MHALCASSVWRYAASPSFSPPFPKLPGRGVLNVGALLFSAPQMRLQNFEPGLQQHLPPPNLSASPEQCASRQDTNDPKLTLAWEAVRDLVR